MERQRPADLLIRDLEKAPEGTRVVGADGAKLGEVVAVYRDRLIVERGFFFPTDYYVPFAAVAAYERGTIYLALSRDEVLRQGWQTPPVDETRPEPIAPAPKPSLAPSTPPPAPAEPTVARPPAAAEPSPVVAPVAAEPPPARPAEMAPPMPSQATPSSPPPTGAESEPSPAEPAGDQPTPSITALPPQESVESPSAEPAEPELEPATTPAPADLPVPAEPPPTAAATAPPAGIRPIPTTERSSTLSRLFPDLVGPAAEPVAAVEPPAPAPLLDDLVAAPSTATTDPPGEPAAGEEASRAESDPGETDPDEDDGEHR